MKEVKSNFPRTFEISPLKTLADAIEGLPIFELREEAVEPFQKALTEKQLSSYSLIVSPADSSSWLGLFWADMACASPDYWLSCPDPDSLLVITGFECFYGKAADPLSFTVMPVRPVQDVVVCESHNLILITGDTEILAINERGSVWHINDLAYDSVIITDVRGGVISGHGDQDWFDRPFKIDASTGRIIKGGI
ncbi:MAG: hypothetical protein JST01_18335 [Cyanobacteria bacterium SZAS TMP-1]|nr:hypothetical protein [Cyanobacteria bacterium SZAS TMP-1]